jgi:hypothetical protein
MTSKIIEYDLKSPSRNYDSVYEVIKSYPVWAHITKSTWFVKTDESCVQIRDKIKKEIDSNDTLFVATLTGEAAWTNVICENDYLKKNL